MKPTFRPYQTEDDFWRMREFLRQVFVLNDYHEWSWHVARLDYARWHTCLNCANIRIDEVAYLWETVAQSDRPTVAQSDSLTDGNAIGQLVAFCMPDGARGEAQMAVHPQWKTLELETEMLDVAEANLFTIQPNGARRLFVWCSEQDQIRQGLLTGRGYTKTEWVESQWRRRLDTAIPSVPLAPGYTLRSLGDGLELLERCYASGLGFHNGDIQVAVENRSDPAWYRNIQTAPLYRRDLDLVAVTDAGEIAAFCTIWFDDVTRSAYYEPVATVPAHQRRGLARALLTEGLLRLKKMGARLAFIGGYETGSSALYGSVFGPDHVLDEAWVKEW